MRLQQLTFDDWLEHSFGREVRFQQAPWYFDPEHDWWDPPPMEAVSYFTRLFEDPGPALQGFADSQIAQGLTYLVNTSASGDIRGGPAHVACGGLALTFTYAIQACLRAPLGGRPARIFGANPLKAAQEVSPDWGSIRGLST